MTYYDKYRSRMLSYGNSETESKRNISKKLIELDIKNSPSYYAVTLNDSTTLIDVRIVDDKESEDEKKYLLSLVSINRGAIVNWSNQKWLTLSSDFIGDIYYKCAIELCNNILHIKTGETKTISGYDPMGRPIYTTTPVFTDFPCIVSQSKSVGTESNQAINLPNGQLFITIPYTELIKEQMEFQMYQRKYKVINVDYTESINQVGLVTLTVERVV